MICNSKDIDGMHMALIIGLLTLMVLGLKVRGGDKNRPKARKEKEREIGRWVVASTSTFTEYVLCL